MEDTGEEKLEGPRFRHEPYFRYTMTQNDIKSHANTVQADTTDVKVNKSITLRHFTLSTEAVKQRILSFWLLLGLAPKSSSLNIYSCSLHRQCSGLPCGLCSVTLSALVFAMAKRHSSADLDKILDRARYLPSPSNDGDLRLNRMLWQQSYEDNKRKKVLEESASITLYTSLDHWPYAWMKLQACLKLPADLPRTLPKDYSGIVENSEAGKSEANYEDDSGSECKSYLKIGNTLH